MEKKGYPRPKTDKHYPRGGGAPPVVKLTPSCPCCHFDLDRAWEGGPIRETGASLGLFPQGEGSGYGRRLGGEGARPGPKWIFGFFPLKLEAPGLDILPSTTGLTAGAYKTWGWVEVGVSAWGAAACPPPLLPQGCVLGPWSSCNQLGTQFSFLENGTIMPVYWLHRAG